jgi:hypothetical protein
MNRMLKMLLPADRQLRRARAERDDGEADDQRLDACRGGEPRRSAHEHLPARHQQDYSRKEEQRRHTTRVPGTRAPRRAALSQE